MNASLPHSPVALVTGSGRRLGNVIARSLSSAGYRLVVHANASIQAAQDTAAELDADGHTAIAIQANIAKEDEVDRLVAQSYDQFGRIDALVNSAAIWEAQALEDVSASDVRRSFEINALGTFLCCQRAGQIMVSQEAGGTIVNIGDWAISRPYPDYSAYFASKGTIPTITRSFAVELAQRNPNVRVNAILPGPVMLPDHLSLAERQAIIQATLLGREGQPENVAHAVQFLLENDFVTGVCLPVDGGRSIFAP